MKFTVRAYRVLLPLSQCVHFVVSNGVFTAVQTLVYHLSYRYRAHYNVQTIAAKACLQLIYM